MATLADAEIGDIVTMEFIVENKYNDDLYTTLSELNVLDSMICFPTTTEISSKRPNIKIGDQVRSLVSSYSGRRSGTVIYIEDGRAWVKWQEGAPSLIQLKNLEKVKQC